MTWGLSLTALVEWLADTESTTQAKKQEVTNLYQRNHQKIVWPTHLFISGTITKPRETFRFATADMITIMERRLAGILLLLLMAIVGLSEGMLVVYQRCPG